MAHAASVRRARLVDDNGADGPEGIFDNSFGQYDANPMGLDGRHAAAHPNPADRAFQDIALNMSSNDATHSTLDTNSTISSFFSSDATFSTDQGWDMSQSGDAPPHPASDVKVEPADDYGAAYHQNVIRGTPLMQHGSLAHDDAAALKRKSVESGLRLLDAESKRFLPSEPQGANRASSPSSSAGKDATVPQQSMSPSAEAKLQLRKERNREIARKSRQRKKAYMKGLEERMKTLEGMHGSMMVQMQTTQEENRRLRSGSDRLMSTMGQLSNENQELRARISVLKSELKSGSRQHNSTPERHPRSSRSSSNSRGSSGASSPNHQPLSPHRHLHQTNGHTAILRPHMVPNASHPPEGLPNGLPKPSSSLDITSLQL